MDFPGGDADDGPVLLMKLLDLENIPTWLHDVVVELVP